MTDPAFAAGEDHLRMTDGFGLFFRRWRPAGEARRAVVCVHGLPGEAGQFELIGKVLAARGTEVYAIDLRGFGNSVEAGLQRGDTRDGKRQRADLEDVVRLVRENHPGRRVFMLGHSIGCDYAIWHAANHRDSVDGLVLLAPGVGLTSKQPAKDLLSLLLFMVLAPTRSYDLQRAFSEGVKNGSELKALTDDPLITTKLSVRCLGALRPLITKVLRNASTVDEPTLIVQGDADVWVRPEGAKELLDSMAAASDKSLRTFPGAGHFLSDLLLPQSASAAADSGERAEVASTIADWLEGR